MCRCKCGNKSPRFLFQIFVQIRISTNVASNFYIYFVIGFDDYLALQCNGISPIKQETEIARPSSYGKTIRNQNVSFNDKVLHRFQTYSPVSVFENSSSSSVEIPNFDKPAFPVKRARSKRHQRTSFGPLFSFSFFPNSPALQKNQEESTPESSSETRTAWKHLNQIKKQQKKDLSLLSGDVEMKRSSSQEPVSHRKCTHCEITKTPQWREGPMGPKTLCNACGVRYRSGRLFPEYRPAASPTFVASVHSNSHKKVLEMRGRGVPDGVRGCTSMSPSSDLPGNYVG